MLKNISDSKLPFFEKCNLGQMRSYLLNEQTVGASEILISKIGALFSIGLSTFFKYLQSTLDISKLWGLFLQVQITRSANLICTTGNLDLSKSIRR